MRTHTQEIQVFSIEDVKNNPELLKKVLEEYRHFNVEHRDWCEDEYLRTWLEKQGYEDVEIAYSGFWSQGDGASFTGMVSILKWIEVNASDKYRRIKKLIESGLIEYNGRIKRDRYTHYVHWNTTSVYMDWEMYGHLGTSATNVSNLLDELEADIVEHHQQLNKELYQEIEKDYEGLTSDESVLDSLEANEYEFTEDGKIF